MSRFHSYVKVNARSPLSRFEETMAQPGDVGLTATRLLRHLFDVLFKVSFQHPASGVFSTSGPRFPCDNYFKASLSFKPKTSCVHNQDGLFLSAVALVLF